jgi:hypothetical protein
MLKAQYARFVEAWNNEKMYQRILLADGAVTGSQELPDKRTVQVIKSEKGSMPILGRKPTFNQWLQAQKNKAFVPVDTPASETKKVEVTNTEW